MNTKLKHWKEAASLILVAGRRLGAGSLPAATPGPPLSVSHARPLLPDSSCFDHNVLLLKRSGKSGFMPDAYVFPGGALHSSDFSSEWLDIFRPFRNCPRLGLRSVKQPPESRPPIFSTDRLKLGSPITGEVALRICALRETFEECGVLLAVSKPEQGGLLKSVGDTDATNQAPLCTVSGLCTSELAKWRTMVNQNPSNFIRMCRELEVVPNIWALHEWSNWLTPVEGYSTRRFDTAFFICCLQETPQTLQDNMEIVCFQWSTPTDALQSFKAQELFIPPPQFYELRRLCHFPLVKDLNNFASQRGTEGCEHWLPVVVWQDEHWISVLPGDRLYPSDSSRKAPVDTESDPQQMDPQDSSGLHRMVVLNTYNINLQITIKPKYNHLLPVIEPPLSYDSKL